MHYIDPLTILFFFILISYFLPTFTLFFVTGQQLCQQSELRLCVLAGAELGLKFLDSKQLSSGG